MTHDLFTERKIAIMQLRKGQTMADVAQTLNRSLGWVSKWKQRYETEGWTGLKERSRAPLKHGNRLPTETKEAIVQARLELEANAELGEGLKYIGGQAIRTRLKQKQITLLPSIPTIERVLRAAGMTKPKSKSVEPQINYPRLRPTQPHQLCQVDIVPHFLQGGERVASFNAIDVVSRYPTGCSYKQRRSQDAAAFLLHVWQEIGTPQYTQVDNEGCFSGGATHPYVIGKVARLALAVGTELVFSPVYHPKSNGSVERFHQDYDQHVWENTYLSDLAAVNKQGTSFFELYRQREDHSQLNDQSPATVHHQQPPNTLDARFQVAANKRPLREGRLHFMRRVSPEGTVRVLNVEWIVPQFDPMQGVWVTVEFKEAGATLAIFDKAPDNQARHCLAIYPFPLSEPVLPRETEIETCDETIESLPILEQEVTRLPKPLPAEPMSPLKQVTTISEWLVLSSISRTARLARQVVFTMY
jgi:transposase InsO family protein